MDDPSTQRPDPDELLADLKSRQTQREKGRLKIFLGMSAGVGKTYAMLQAAKHLKGDGRDVVIGVVETHGRAETEKLVDGLECIPRRRLAYKGTQLQEMDLDAILL